jgi:tRNA U38,U39,U40 pseudouridine synthase TruA
MDRIIKDLNADLPFDIRIFIIRKLGKNFDMRHDAHTRIYNYICPIKLFLPIQDFKDGKVMNEMEKEEIVHKLN